MFIHVSNKFQVIEVLLTKSKTAMDNVNKQYRTALHLAAYKQHVESVRVLLQNNCDVTIQVNK